MLRLIKVTGQSLSPDYLEGDFVLIAKIPFFFHFIRHGDVVVFMHPQYGVMIKQVERIDHQARQVFVVGTHPTSVDSHKFGPVRADRLMGKVIWHISKPAEQRVKK